MGHDDNMAQKNKGFVSGKAKYTTIWEKAPVINGKEEWFLQSVYNVEHLDQDGVQDLRQKDPVVAVQVSQAAIGRATVCAMRNIFK